MLWRLDRNISRWRCIRVIRTWRTSWLRILRPHRRRHSARRRSTGWLLLLLIARRTRRGLLRIWAISRCIVLIGRSSHLFSLILRRSPSVLRPSQPQAIHPSIKLLRLRELLSHREGLCTLMNLAPTLFVDISPISKELVGGFH